MTRIRVQQVQPRHYAPSRMGLSLPLVGCQIFIGKEHRTIKIGEQGLRRECGSVGKRQADSDSVVSAGTAQCRQRRRAELAREGGYRDCKDGPGYRDTLVQDPGAGCQDTLVRGSGARHQDS